MKKYFLIAALFCAMAFVGCKKEEAEIIPQIPENMEIAFPDPLFREYVLTNFDTNGDGKISKAEADAVTEINVGNHSATSDESKLIKSLEGIQYFRNLISLQCGQNLLTSLDVSKNTQLAELWCYSNQLTDLDVSKNTQLTRLYCYSNQLTDLDVSKNTQLTRLYCDSNQLTTLDVSKTNLGNSAYSTPLDCASMSTLETLYLKKGWSIRGITEDYGRSTSYIPAQTKIVFVD